MTKSIARARLAQLHRDGAHNPVGFRQDLEDALIMLDVVKAQLAALAIFQPFLRGLVAADVKAPGHLGRIRKALGGFDPDLPPGSSLAKM